MNNASIMKIFHDAGAIITDSHLVYTSGRHGKAYVNKDALYLHPQSTAALCKEMAAQYDANSIDVVVGPTIGGVILSQWVAYHLNTMRSEGEVLSVYAEEIVEDGEKKRIFKRGYDLTLPNKNILVVEDILTTGGSARKVIEAIRSSGGKVIGLSVLCNRGGITEADMSGVPIHSLASVTLDSWDESECPLCEQNIPVNVSIGKGRDFLEKRKQKL